MRHVTRKGLMTVAAATGVIAAAGGYAHADSGAIGSASHSPGVLSGNVIQAPVHVPVNVCGNTVDVAGLLNPAAGNACGNHGGSAASGGHGDESGSGGHGGGTGSGGGYGDDDASGGYGGDNGTGGGHSGGGGASGGYGDEGSHGSGGSGAHAGGSADGSSGVGSGNHVEAPIDVPVNVCGNSVDVAGLLNPTTGNGCGNDSGYGDDDTPPGGDHQSPGKPGHQGPGTPDHSGPSRSEQPSTPGHMTPVGAPNADLPTRATASELAHTGSELPIGMTLSSGAAALLAGAVLYRRARHSA